MALRQTTWRISHGALAAVIIAGTVVHAVLIKCTMEPISKAELFAFVVVATAVTLAKLRY